MNAALRIIAPIVVFCFGGVLLSHYHYAIQRGWPMGRIFSSSDRPSVFAIVLCGFSQLALVLGPIAVVASMFVMRTAGH